MAGKPKPRSRSIAASKPLSRAKGSAPPRPARKESILRSLRFFGPFWSGSDFSQVKLTYANNVLKWTFGDYFTTHADPSLYNAVFPRGLPSGPPAPSASLPGAFPARDGLGDFTFALHEISYSSRFGGSVRMRFLREPRAGYDLRKANRLWDFEGLELSVYAAPQPLAFNRPAQSVLQVPAHCELTFASVTAYEIPAGPAWALPEALEDAHAS